MRNNIIPQSVTINLGSFIESGGSPIDLFLPNTLCKKIQFNKLKGVMSSYPILKEGDFYELSVEVEPKMVFSNWGGEKQWTCLLSNIIYPMAMRLKEEYDTMVSETKKEDNPFFYNEIRKGGTYECYHSLSDLYVEEIIIDTDNLTVEMVLGS